MSNPGTDWSATEIERIVSEYFVMLKHELGNTYFVKADHNRNVQKFTGRSKGAIEYKFQNISAVLSQLGLPWIKGYAPMANFQRALLLGIETFLSQKENVFSIFEPTGRLEFAENDGLYLDPPPLPNQAHSIPNEALERLIRKFDPAVRDERNRALGKKGEELVLQFERFRLNRENPDLAKKIKWVSQEEGDGAGYDILSFEPNGKERLIEVKTTVGYQQTPFFISANELALSNERPDHFRLMRVFDFLKGPRAFELQPPLLHSLILTPQNYRASFQ